MQIVYIDALSMKVSNGCGCVCVCLQLMEDRLMEKMFLSFFADLLGKLSCELQSHICFFSMRFQRKS